MKSSAHIYAPFGFNGPQRPTQRQSEKPVIITYAQKVVEVAVGRMKKPSTLSHLYTPGHTLC